MTTGDRFKELTTRFAPALRFLDEQSVPIQAMNIQDGRLMVRGVAHYNGQREQIVDRFRAIDPTLGDVHLDIRIEAGQNVPSTGQTNVQTSQDFSQRQQIPSSKR